MSFSLIPDPGSSLLESLKRENETVVRQLMDSGMAINDTIKRQALDVIEKEGLVSMATILEK